MMGFRGVKEIDPVREFTGDTRRLTDSVLAELSAARAQMILELGTLELKTFDEYRNRRGKVEGMDIAISICKEVQRKLEA